MSNKFLFLVALTPQKFLNPLRIELQRASFSSLANLKYDNYQVLLLGDEDKIEEKLHFLQAPDGRKGDRLKFALDYLQKHEIDYDYICRFDDDDLINPNILELHQHTSANCIADEYHSFLDLNTCKTIAAKKGWLANTVFHKKEDALAIVEDGRTLIEQDHAEEWHKYYAGKQVVQTKKKHPIYLRIISPTSETAGYGNDYQTYLNNFGNWNKPTIFKDFEEAIQNCLAISEVHFPDGAKTPSLQNNKVWWKSLFKISL